jgi:hypothetical protein
LREERSEQAYRLLGNLFGINGDLSAIRSKIHEYMNTADAVIGQLRGKVLAAYSSHIEISNEIETAKNPVDLLLMIFDDRYHQKIRFEAKRKLVLMGLAGSIDQRERETDIENKFATFLNFLNQYVWSPQLKIGELPARHLARRIRSAAAIRLRRHGLFVPLRHLSAGYATGARKAATAVSEDY